MPWYRQGSVAITAGQNTVTGTGTSFSANSRVGDAFQGPDGRWYEVTNIASATVMSILPAYQGATVAGGAHGLAPMQGYVKESADRLRQIVEQWGSTLAGLGAVSTENVVPIAKGGTGATTQADAMIALGLGTAATKNIGMNLGDAQAVGSFGVGTNYPAMATSMNTWVGGFYAIQEGNTTYVQNTGIISGNMIAMGFPFGTSLGAQIWMGTGAAGAVIGFRAGDYAGATFNKIYHTGNTTRAADGTLKAI